MSKRSDLRVSDDRSTLDAGRTIWLMTWQTMDALPTPTELPVQRVYSLYTYVLPWVV